MANTAAKAMATRPMDSNEDDHYAALQLSPLAEPEVIAAAYRALAKKYHPDRSRAPGAMVKMARINVAYQALKLRTPSGAADVSAPAPESPSEPATAFTQERIDPALSLDQVMAAVARKAPAPRQQLVDEVVRNGLPRDTAANLVRQALRDLAGGPSTAASGRAAAKGERLQPDASYDRALALATSRAEAARTLLADGLVQDGLPRAAAVELVDAALDSLRRRPGTAAPRERRLSPERVRLDATLEQGVEVTTQKLRAAFKLVVDELARDGVPQQTAQQLAQTALDGMASPRRR